MADPLYGKKEDRRGEHTKIPVSDFRKQTFLKWLCTPLKERDPRTISDLADQLGVSRRTLQNWRDDKEFIEEWEKLYIKNIGDPSRKQEIMDTLYRTATDPDDPKHVQAARQYFEIEGSVKPQKMQVEVSGSAKDLTTEELQRIAAMQAGARLHAIKDEEAS